MRFRGGGLNWLRFLGGDLSFVLNRPFSMKDAIDVGVR
jgi:hypothetical protein